MATEENKKVEEQKITSVMDALENLEKIIYRILIWVILIPKTLLMIVLKSIDVPRYIKDELEKGNSRFDEYFTPVWLLLVVALLPFVLWQYIPTPGAQITSDNKDTPNAEQQLEFTAEVRFISTVINPGPATGFVITYWQMEKENILGDKYVYQPLPEQQVRHTNNYAERPSATVLKPKSVIGKGTAKGRQTESDVGNDYYEYVLSDNHVIKDTYTADLIPGTYRLSFVAAKFEKTDSEYKQIETYTGKVIIYVPEDNNENVIVDESGASRLDAPQRLSFEEVRKQLQSEDTIFFAIGMLISPLLFAFATNLVAKSGISSAENQKDPLSEDGLKEIFYIQCYYFSPVALVFWVYMYIGRFLTPDVFGHLNRVNLIIQLPVFLIVIWFVLVQTHTLVKEHGIHPIGALSLVEACIVLLAFGTRFIGDSNLPQLQDEARVNAIEVYAVIAIVLLLVGLFAIAHPLSSDWREELVKLITKNDSKNWMLGIDRVAKGSGVLIMLIFAIQVFQGKTAFITSETFEKTQKSMITQAIAGYASEIADATKAAPSLTPMASATFVATTTSTSISIPSFTLTPTSIPASTSPVTVNSGETTSSPKAVFTNSKSPTPVTATATKPTQSATATPTPINTSTTTPSPTSTPLPDSDIYRDEFNSNFRYPGQWSYFATMGNENAVHYTFTNKALTVQLDPDSNDIYSYLLNTKFSYTGVQIETRTDNIGENPNAVSLICRANDTGWYEFEIDNSGYAVIYAYDASGYTSLADGYLTEVQQRPDFNTYTVNCNADQLKLYVNDALVAFAEDKQFTDGYIGLGVSSVDGQTVKVDFDYINVSAP